MSTVEKLFGKFFERKNSVIEQLNQQKDLYDQYLASTCLIKGIRPPSWLLKDGFEAGSSELKELKNEDLISGLLFPPPRANYPSSIGSKTFYSRSIIAANTVKQLSGDFFSETCASNKYFRVGERSADIPNCPLDGDNMELESTLSTVPELDHTIFSPQNQTNLNNHFDVTTVGERLAVDPKCNLNGNSLKSECTFNTIAQHGGTTGTPECQTDLKVSKSGFELPQSLARIQRSRSRQRALELRNSASGKSRKRDIQESNAAVYAGRSTRLRTSSEQPRPVKELLETDARISSIPYQDSGSIARLSTFATQNEDVDLGNVLDTEGNMERSSLVQQDLELCNSVGGNIENNPFKENTTYEDNIRSQTILPQINSAELVLVKRNNSDTLTGRIAGSRSSSINRSPQHVNPLDLVERHDLTEASDPRVFIHEEISVAGIAENRHVNVPVGCNSTCSVTKQEGVSMGASLEFLISRPQSDDINLVEPKQLIFDDVEDSRLGETFGPSLGRETLQASGPQLLIREEISAARIAQTKHVADMPVDHKSICSVHNQEDVSVGASLECSASRPQSGDMKKFEPKQLIFGDVEDSGHVETVGPSPVREILNQSPEVGSTPLGLTGSVDEVPISGVLHEKDVLSDDGGLLKMDHRMEMVIENEKMMGSLPHVEESFENVGRELSLESAADTSKLCSPLLKAERSEGYEGSVTDRSPESNEISVHVTIKSLKNINMSSVHEKCTSIPDDCLLKIDQYMEVVDAETELKANSGTSHEKERFELVEAEKAEFDLHPISSPISKTSSISALSPWKALCQLSDVDVDTALEGSKMLANKVQVTGCEFFHEPCRTSTDMDHLGRDGEKTSIRFSNVFYEDERPELLSIEETRDLISSAMCTGAVSNISSRSLRKESPDINQNVVPDTSPECEESKPAPDSSFWLKALQYGRSTFGCKLEGTVDIDLPDVGVDANKDSSGKNLTREFDLESLQEDSGMDTDACFGPEESSTLLKKSEAPESMSSHAVTDSGSSRQAVKQDISGTDTDACFGPEESLTLLKKPEAPETMSSHAVTDLGSTRQIVKQDISLVHDASQVPYLLRSTIHEQYVGCRKLNDSSSEKNSIQSATTSTNGWENSWPQCKRRKIEDQSNKGFTTFPRIRSLKPNHREDIVCRNLKSAEAGLGADLEFQQFSVSGVVESSQSSIIESAVGEMSHYARHLIMENVQYSPQIHADEAEVDGEFALGDVDIPLGFKPILLESSLGSSGIKPEDSGIHLNEVEEQYPFSVSMSMDSQYDQKFCFLESKKTPGCVGEVCSIEQDIQEIESNLEEKLLSNYEDLDLVGADQSMPEFEKFTDLPNTIIEGMSILEDLCPSSSMGTPYSLPSKSKLSMDLSTWSGYNPLEPDFMPSSSDQSECDAWSPYTPQVGKATHNILSISGGQCSKKQRSTNSELTPIHEYSSSSGEENRDLCKVIYQLQEKTSAVEMKSSTFREPLLDISNINPLELVSENEKIFERGSLVDSLKVDTNPQGFEIGTSKKSKDDYGNEKKYKNKDKENKNSSIGGYGTERKNMNEGRERKSSSICGSGIGKSTGSLQNTVSKPNLRSKATEEKRNCTIVDKGRVGSNIATDVKSFTQYIQPAVLPGKRKELKPVKAIEKAKERKYQEEEKTKQREMMKVKWERERERLKEEKARERELIQRQKEEKEREREKLKEEKAREQALNQKRKEEEAKRKEAEMLERKRRREEDEKKGKDRKRVCKEQQRKVHAEKEEKELKYRAADGRASKKKGFQDEEMKDQNPEKVKGREECAKGRQAQTKKASGVNEHSVALKESHSNENAVSCFCQVNEVVASATDGTLEQSYDISPYISSDVEEDDDVPTRKVIPSWSRQYCQAPLYCSQQPKNIFPQSSFCNINQVLRSRKSAK